MAFIIELISIIKILSQNSENTNISWDDIIYSITSANTRHAARDAILFDKYFKYFFIKSDLNNDNILTNTELGIFIGQIYPIINDYFRFELDEIDELINDILGDYINNNVISWDSIMYYKDINIDNTLEDEIVGVIIIRKIAAIIINYYGKNMFNNIDVDNDGKITISEFLFLMFYLIKPKLEFFFTIVSDFLSTENMLKCKEYVTKQKTNKAANKATTIQLSEHYVLSENTIIKDNELLLNINVPDQMEIDYIKKFFDSNNDDNISMEEIINLISVEVNPQVSEFYNKYFSYFFTKSDLNSDNKLSTEEIKDFFSKPNGRDINPNPIEEIIKGELSVKDTEEIKQLINTFIDDYFDDDDKISWSYIMHYAEINIDSDIDDNIVFFIIIRKIIAIIINSYAKDLFYNLDEDKDGKLNRSEFVYFIYIFYERIISKMKILKDRKNIIEYNIRNFVIEQKNKRKYENNNIINNEILNLTESLNTCLDIKTAALAQNDTYITEAAGVKEIAVLTETANKVAAEKLTADYIAKIAVAEKKTADCIAKIAVANKSTSDCTVLATANKTVADAKIAAAEKLTAACVAKDGKEEEGSGISNILIILLIILVFIYFIKKK